MKALKTVGILVVLLIALGILIDRVGVAIAESKVAGTLQSHFNLDSKPSVDINGFPVITQALAGSYKSIDVSAHDVPVESLGAVDVLIRLRGLHLTIGDAIAGRINDAIADDLYARVTMNDADLSHALGMDVKIGKIDASTARLRISTTRAGITIPMQADVHVAVDGDGVKLTVSKLVALAVPIPDTVSSQISKVLSSRLVLPELAGGLKLTGVQVGSGTITVTAEGHGVPLGGG